MTKLFEAELRGRIQATENARKHFEQVFQGMLAYSTNSNGDWHADWLEEWLAADGLKRAMMETEMIMNGVEDE